MSSEEIVVRRTMIWRRNWRTASMDNLLPKLTSRHFRRRFSSKYRVTILSVDGFIQTYLGFEFGDFLNEDGTIDVSDTAALEALANDLKDNNVNVKRSIFTRLFV